MPVTVHPAPANGTYEPQVDSLFIPALSFHNMDSLAELGNHGRWPFWRIATDEYVSAVVQLPDHWTTFDYAVVIKNAVTDSTGNVTFQARYAEVDVAAGGSSAQPANQGSATTFPMPAYSFWDEVTITAGIACNPAKLANVQALRSATNDTYGARDVYLSGIRLTKAS